MISLVLRAILPVFAVLGFGVPAAAGQKIFVDQLGSKGGALERLSSAQGRAALVAEILPVVQAAGDSIYFVFESADFSEAVLLSAYREADGRFSGTAHLRRRRTSGTAACEASRLKAGDIDYRADRCYYNDAEYNAALVFPQLSFASAPAFVDIALDLVDALSPMQSVFEFIDADPKLKSEFAAALDTYRVNKGAGFVARLLLLEQGWERNFTEPKGWGRTTASLSTDQAKVLAGIRRLQADNRVYLSVNVWCSSSKSGRAAIVDRAQLDPSCRPTTLMGEHLSHFYDSMEAAGYRYDSATQKWN